MTTTVRDLPLGLSRRIGVATTAAGLVLAGVSAAPFPVIVAGVIIIFLGSGVTEILGARTVVAQRWVPLVVGLAWCEAALWILFWPGIAPRSVAVVAGVALLAEGWQRLLLEREGTEADRSAAVMNSAATAGFGALALAWPGITAAGVAVLVAARTVLHGTEILLASGHLLPGGARVPMAPAPAGAGAGPGPGTAARTGVVTGAGVLTGAGAGASAVLRTVGPWAAGTVVLVVGLAAYAL